jgi:hypothetical protein
MVLELLPGFGANVASRGNGPRSKTRQKISSAYLLSARLYWNVARTQSRICRKSVLAAANFSPPISAKKIERRKPNKEGLFGGDIFDADL